MEEYRALVVQEDGEGNFCRDIQTVPRSFLPENDVLIKVHYAGLNYKDALSASGHKGITRKFPHTPGVDASGIVVESKSDKWKTGDKVIVTSYDLGMNTKGGFAEYVSVPREWPVSLPASMSLEESMILGTAAYTAALAIHKMEKAGQHPEMGAVVVSGASGGVGSMAVALLHSVGYEVIASSGKQEHYNWLKSLGAKNCVNREFIRDESGKPLLSPRWAGAIDTIGGNTLETLLKACNRNGNIATCGLVASHELHTTVYPFILNGVNLLGIDSAETPRDLREKVWSELETKYQLPKIDKMGEVVALEEIPHYMDEILKGETVGRIVAKI